MMWHLACLELTANTHIYNVQLLLLLMEVHVEIKMEDGQLLSLHYIVSLH
jgi:hypothetical protein